MIDNRVEALHSEFIKPCVITFVEYKSMSRNQVLTHENRFQINLSEDISLLHGDIPDFSKIPIYINYTCDDWDLLLHTNVGLKDIPIELFSYAEEFCAFTLETDRKVFTFQSEKQQFGFDDYITHHVLISIYLLEKSQKSQILV